MAVNVNYPAAGGLNGGTVVQNITQVTNNSYNATGNQLISGGGVVWRGNYDYTVAAATYQIQGASYTSPQTNLTLSASDPTNDRIDLIVVNSSGAVTVITGTPAATPAQPSFDPTTQIPLTFVYVTAASTQPATATNENIYLENTEWTGAASGAGFNLASTNNPFQGTKDIEATAVVAGNYVEYTKPAAGSITPDQYNTLVFVLRSKAAWPNGKSLTIQLYNGTSPVGVPVTVKDGVSNFVSSVTGNYQFIVLATSLFQSAGLTVNKIRISVAGGGGSIGFYLDYWFWQAGVVQTQAAAPMIFRGTWSNAVSYEPNDVVFTAGAAYIALSANVNSDPATHSTIWDLFPGSAGSGTVTNVSFTNQATGVQVSVATPTTTPVLSLSGPVGYLNIPQNSQSAAYTTVAADSGKHIFHPSSDANPRTFTIDSNANVPYPIGTAITFINMSASAVTIAITADTLTLAGTGSAGSRTLAQYGAATAVKIGTTAWIIYGTGLT